MPHTKFQIVFAADDMVEIFILIEGELRKTTVDLSDAPFARSLLGEPSVNDALKAWMLEASGPSWISWNGRVPGGGVGGPEPGARSEAPG